MTQKNLLIKNININKFTLYFNFYKYFYDKVKNINYTIAVLFVYNKYKFYLNKLFMNYSNLYFKTFYKNEIVLKLTNYLQLSNKHKYIDYNKYKNININTFFLLKNKELYHYKMKNLPNKLNIVFFTNNRVFFKLDFFKDNFILKKNVIYLLFIYYKIHLIL